MNVTVNGEKKDIKDDFSVEDLMVFLEIPKEGIVVELNYKIIKRDDWRSTILEQGDKVELVRFVGGG